MAKSYDINNRNAHEWVNKFLEGLTSAEEERMLYEFFARPGIPKELNMYKEMYAWYSGMPQENHLSANLKQAKRRTNKWVAIISIAASVVLIFSICMQYHKDQQLRKELLCYEGSYIVRNGKKITDLRLIMPQIRQSEQMAREIENEINKTQEEELQSMHAMMLETASCPEEIELIESALQIN